MAMEPTEILDKINLKIDSPADGILLTGTAQELESHNFDTKGGKVNPFEALYKGDNEQIWPRKKLTETVNAAMKPLIAALTFAQKDGLASRVASVVGHRSSSKTSTTAAQVTALETEIEGPELAKAALKLLGDAETALDCVSKVTADLDNELAVQDVVVPGQKRVPQVIDALDQFVNDASSQKWIQDTFKALYKEEELYMQELHTAEQELLQRWQPSQFRRYNFEVPDTIKYRTDYFSEHYTLYTCDLGEFRRRYKSNSRDEQWDINRERWTIKGVKDMLNLGETRQVKLDDIWDKAELLAVLPKGRGWDAGLYRFPNMVSSWWVVCLAISRDVIAHVFLWDKWNLRDQKMKELNDWMLTRARFDATSHLLATIRQELKHFLGVTLTIHSACKEITRCLQNIIVNASCQVPMALKLDLEELSQYSTKLTEAFQALANVNSTIRPWLKDEAWSGRVFLEGGQGTFAGKTSSEPPKGSEESSGLIFGISLLDMTNGDSIRIKSVFNPETGPRPGYSNTKPWAMAIDWLQLPQDNKGVDWGTATTFNLIQNQEGPETISAIDIKFKDDARQIFSKSGEQVHVVAWLKNINVTVDGQHHARVSVYPDQVTADGFRLCAKTWKTMKDGAVTEDATVNEVVAGWLAYSDSCQELWSTRISTSKKFKYNQPASEEPPTSVSFDGRYGRTPRFAGFISKIDISPRYAQRVEVHVENVTRDMARLHAESWWDTELSLESTFVCRGVPA